MSSAVAVLLLAYLPGTLLFRLPKSDRSKRAALSAEERLFWSVLLSLIFSSVVGLGLAAGGWYRFSRLLWAAGGFSVVTLVAFRGRLRFQPAARSASWTALIPLAIIVAGFWLNFRVPPAEYVIGGRDPGIYMSEGIQIAQGGGLVLADETVSSVPPLYRNLFFPQGIQAGYFSSRFMGFFLLDPGSGAVVGQFPHLFPVWIAIAYGTNGLSGARSVPAFCGLLGLLAVYFAGARIMGRTAAAAGALLLAVNVVQVWYARYPNAEILVQPLVFAGVLAYVRATHDDDGFFAPVAAVLFALSAFTHLTGALAVVAILAVSIIDAVVVGNRRVRTSFWLPLLLGTSIAAFYLWRYIPPYFNVPLGFIQNLRMLHFVLAAGALVVGVLLLRAARGLSSEARRLWVSTVLIAVIWTLAAYAYFIRTADAGLAPHDADSLRTFVAFYVSPLGLAAALFGFALLARSSADGLALLVPVAAFSAVFFYKIRIVPEHFWAARRFLAVVLPGSMLLVGAAAFYDARDAAASRLAKAGRGATRMVRYAAGLVLVLGLGWTFARATQPVLHHVEYAGLIPHLEQLAATFGDNDLVLVESRGASDSHVLALPLAYIYARNVLVFSTTNPDKQAFRGFLTWALGKYRRVFFMGGGGGGTELLSRSMTVTPIRGERFQIPEYESALNAYPRGVRFKEFDLSVYEFLPHPADQDVFTLDVGSADDLFVRRFYAKEQSPAGFTFRWTRDVSFVSAVGMQAGQRTVTLWMGSGGRPPAGGPAVVEVALDNRVLGKTTVGDGLLPYRFDIPPDLAAAMAQSEDATQLRISTQTWTPSQVVGGRDERALGVMLDRIEIR